MDSVIKIDSHLIYFIRILFNLVSKTNQLKKEIDDEFISNSKPFNFYFVLEEFRQEVVCDSCGLVPDVVCADSFSSDWRRRPVLY